MDAYTERMALREQLSENVIPSDILHSVQLYKHISSKPDWRATRFVEHLGECAIRLHELLNINGSQPLPDDNDIAFSDELLYRSMEDALEERKEIMSNVAEQYGIPDTDI